MDTTVAVANSKAMAEMFGAKDKVGGMLRLPRDYLLDHFTDWPSMSPAQKRDAVDAYFKEHNRHYQANLRSSNSGIETELSEKELSKIAYVIENRETAKAMYYELSSRGFIELYMPHRNGFMFTPARPLVDVMPDGIRSRLNVLSMKPESRFPPLHMMPMLARLEAGKYYIYDYTKESALVEHFSLRAKERYPDAFALLPSEFRYMQSVNELPEFFRALWKPAKQ